MTESNPALESPDVVALIDEPRTIEIIAQSVLGLWVYAAVRDLAAEPTRMGRPGRRSLTVPTHA